MSEVVASADEPSDEAVVARLAGGDQESVVPLLVRYAPQVLSLASSALDRAAAEEIVQEVFVAVWRGASGFDPARGTFRSWLLSITRNRIANELRRRGRRPDARGTAEPDDWAAVSDPGPGPADVVWQDFRRQTLRAAVDSLPQKQRQALSLAFFDELTHEQVAAALDVPLGTAKTRIRSALETLRGQLTPMRASFLIGLFLLAGLFWRDQYQGTRLGQERRALWLVTTSDVVPIRLEPVPGVEPKTHGTYRGRPGETLAVMTFSNFAPASSGREFVAWARHDEHWTRLGNVSLDSAGNGRLVAEAPALSTPPDALRVTLEATGDRSAKTPAGTIVIAWPAEK